MILGVQIYRSMHRIKTIGGEKNIFFESYNSHKEKKSVKPTGFSAKIAVGFCGILLIISALASNVQGQVIAVNDFANYRVFQREIGGTSKSVTVSGTYSNMAWNRVEARVLRAWHQHACD